MISNRRYYFLLGSIIIVYILGMFVTLFENDSAQFAVMAMRMYQENDFINLIKGTQEYLDKPHMHYWLAALSYKLFGLHDWAYRIPGILACFLGAYSCFGLGKLLYNKEVGRIASLVFLTAQTIVLANIDVRTDAVLTGFTIFSIWQLTTYIKKGNLKNILWGAFGAGIAFSTKGQIAILVIGLPVFCYLLYSREWKALWNWKVLIALLLFGITISPMLYAYYHQFDLHPEKVIRGKNNRSGIFFIFWEQSFERLSGEGHGKNSSDFFFFYHTFLWVFLPWTLIALGAIYSAFKSFFKLKFKYVSGYEFLTLGGIILIFQVISFAQFKLPHYLNITIPLFAVLSAAYVYRFYKEGQIKPLNVLLKLQYFVVAIVILASVLLTFFVFEVTHWWYWILFTAGLGTLVFYLFKKEEQLLKIITISVMGAVLINVVMNGHFYPELLKYQAGSEMAKIVKKEEISTDKIYKIYKEKGGFTWGLDFYNQDPVNLTTLNDITSLHDAWLYVDDKELEMLKKQDIALGPMFSVDQFRITRLQAKFINKKTRHKVLRKRHLVYLE